LIRAGSYRESVTPNSGVTIMPYNGEPVTVDGTDPVTNWTVYQSSIYQASVTLSNDDTNQVFVGRKMMTEARWPNGDDLFHVNWATMGAGTNDSQLIDSNLPSVDWTGSKVHLLGGADPWFPQTATVASSSTGRLSMSLDNPDFSPYIQPQAAVCTIFTGPQKPFSAASPSQSRRVPQTLTPESLTTNSQRAS
jgi:hypothetical protein